MSYCGHDECKSNERRDHAGLRAARYHCRALCRVNRIVYRTAAQAEHLDNCAFDDNRHPRLALCLRVLVSHEHARDRRIVITGLKRPERHRSVALCALLAGDWHQSPIALKGVVGWLSLLPLVYLFDMMFKMRHSTHYTLGLKPLLLTGFVYVCWPGANPSAVGLILTVLICSGLGHQRAGTAAYRIVQRLPIHAVVHCDAFVSY